MLTLDALRKLGADTDEGMSRCMNDETFYLSLVKMVPEEEGYQRLRDAIEAGNLDAAFEAAHALKGVLANLSLTSMQEKVSEITELLRARTEMDYAPLLEEIAVQREELERLCGEE